ncbi:MAG: phytanoyl-CoA dioxygenase family protein [Myxococcota bacterium]
MSSPPSAATREPGQERPLFDHVLTDEELASWRRDHRLVLRGACDGDALAHIRTWTDELASWPETPGKWMAYYERHAQDDTRMLCRIENFIPYHAGYKDLIQGPALMTLLSALMGEEAVLFKEKINFKLPGGAGFAPHQDAPAFASFGHRYHITMMVAIDDATTQNGCLEFAPPTGVGELLTPAADGTIDPDVVASMPWAPLETKAGDVVFFDSYIPHRSPGNSSDAARRATYVTYNRLAEGDVRTAYFEKKRAAFPPECERVEGVDYSQSGGTFNLGNPIR